MSAMRKVRLQIFAGRVHKVAARAAASLSRVAAAPAGLPSLHSPPVFGTELRSRDIVLLICLRALYPPTADYAQKSAQHQFVERLNKRRPAHSFPSNLTSCSQPRESWWLFAQLRQSWNDEGTGTLHTHFLLPPQMTRSGVFGTSGARRAGSRS